VSVAFADGSAGDYDLVVGADGIHSTVRGAAVSQKAPSYAGAVSWRSIIPARPRGVDHLMVFTGERRYARRTSLPPGSFDLVHARTLLVNVPEPAEVLAEMVRLARPGGWVASLEPDVESALCYPPHPAYARMWELFRATFGRHGADLLIGRRLAELYRQAGLHNIGIEARARICQPGDSRRTIGPDLVRSLHPMIVSLGLADQGELDALDRAVRSHLDDPRTLVIPHLSFLARGRKPETQQP
jgi:SAM-dependent methyltransferase